MTDREKLARQWAKKTTPKGDRETLAAIEHILATTSPPTMAGVEWDHEKHHLAGAVFQNAGTDTTAEVVMFQKIGTGAIFAVDDEDGQPFIGDASKYTPNGKRYELREVPDHPEALVTLEDYKNAPAKTLVCFHDCEPFLKEDDGGWTVQGGHPWSDEELEGTRRSVLRWGVEA